MQTFELLDRFELLYPTNIKLADLRRAYIDKDLSSIFRLTNADEDLRKAIMEENLHSIFRLVLPEKGYDVEDLRKSVVEKNLNSIFRLVDNEDLRKLILEDNTWKLWGILDSYQKTHFVAAFKNFFVNNIKIDDDCFSRGQLQSKMWLVRELKRLKIDLGTIFLCAGWYGILATMLFESKIQLKKIRSFDIDRSTVKIAEIFNAPWVKEDWKFKAVHQDILEINYDNHVYEVFRSDGTYCNLVDSPDTVINTSCEHILEFDKWYHSIPEDKLCVLQGNNFVEVDEHINCFSSLEDFSNRIPMNTVLFEGELPLQKYTRYMKIGYR